MTAPRKERGGCDRVIYLRANKELVEDLADLQREANARWPGVSLADIARALLRVGLAAELATAALRTAGKHPSEWGRA